MGNLLTESRGNTKLRKSERDEYRILGLSLFPAMTPVICSHATPNCIRACVGKTGLIQVFTAIGDARKRKTRYFLDNRKAFEEELCAEIEHEQRLADWLNQILVIRGNVYSDIDWSHIARRFPRSRWYDYSKNLARWHKIRSGDWPSNYSLTFSRSETNEYECATILNEGGNVSVVFANPGPGFCKHGAYSQKLPGFWTIGGVRAPVTDGDLTDLRFTDPTCDAWHSPTPGRGWIIGLRLKSDHESDRQHSISSGFAVTYVP